MLGSYLDTNSCSAKSGNYRQKSLELFNLRQSNSSKEKIDADGARASIRSCCGKQHRDKSCHTAARGSLLMTGTWPNICLARSAAALSREDTSHRTMSCSFMTEQPKLLTRNPGRPVWTETEYRKALDSASCAL